MAPSARRLRRLRRRGLALVASLPLAAGGCTFTAPAGLQDVLSSSSGPREVTLVSNQESTVFRGKLVSGPPGAFIRGVQQPTSQPDAQGLVNLGQGKFVKVMAHPQGAYEIYAQPPGYRERSLTVAPPLTRRVSFTFEISDREGARPSASEPTLEVVVRPRVEIQSPSGTKVSDNAVTIILTARTEGGVRDVKITVNGDPVKAPAREQTRGKEFSATQKVDLVPGSNLIHAVVTDAEGRVGYSTLTVERSSEGGGLLARLPGARRRDRKFAPRYARKIGVAIGIDAYRHWPRLEGGVGDARRVAAALRELGFDEVLGLYDEDATRAGILRLLGEELPARAEEEDLVVIFFAGHGETETLPNGEKRGYIVPVEAPVEGVFSSAISMDTLRDISNRVRAKHVYYAMDSCYSGLGFTRGISPVPKTRDYVDKITSFPAVQMITAGMEGELAIERGGHGLFTTYWLRAVKGEADVDGDGVVTAGEIGNYVRPAVTRASEQRQTPLYGTIDGGGEIAFILR